MQYLSHVLCQQCPLTALLLALNSWARCGWRTTQGFLQPESPPSQVLAASSSTRKKGNVNHTKGPNISANNSHPGRSRVQITLQHFMGSSCRELLTDLPQTAHQEISVPHRTGYFWRRFHSSCPPPVYPLS